MGALDFLQKPVDEDQIRQAIQGILNFSEKSPKDLLLVEDNLVHREALAELIKNQDIRVMEWKRKNRQSMNFRREPMML